MPKVALEKNSQFFLKIVITLSILLSLSYFRPVDADSTLNYGLTSELTFLTVMVDQTRDPSGWTWIMWDNELEGVEYYVVDIVHEEVFGRTKITKNVNTFLVNLVHKGRYDVIVEAFNSIDMVIALGATHIS